MIWTILLYTALIIAGLFLLLILILLLSPFYIGTEFSRTEENITGEVRFWWLNKRFLNVAYDFTSKNLAAKLLWFHIMTKNEDDSEHKIPMPENLSAEKVKTDSKTPEEHRIAAEPSGRDDIEDEDNAGSTEAPLEDSFSGREKGDSVKPEPELKKEKMEDGTKKGDGIIDKLKRNRVLFFLRDGRWRRKVTKWLVRVLRSFFYIVAFDRFQMRIKAGVEDPSVMGLIYGFFQAVQHGLTGQFQNIRIDFEPVFMDNLFQFEGATGIRSSIGKLLFPVIVALFTFPYLTTLWLWWKSRKIVKSGV